MARVTFTIMDVINPVDGQPAIGVETQSDPKMESVVHFESCTEAQKLAINIFGYIQEQIGPPTAKVKVESPPAGVSLVSEKVLN